VGYSTLKAAKHSTCEIEEHLSKNSISLKSEIVKDGIIGFYSLKTI
jgi:hypothetical protein